MIDDLQTWRTILCWVLAIVALVPAVLPNRAGLARVATLPVGPARNRMYRQILLVCSLQFGALGLVMALQLGGLSSVWHLPAEFAPLHASLDFDLGAFFGGMGIGAVGLGLAIVVNKIRHPEKPWLPAPRAEPNPLPFIPRTYGERWWGAAVSVNAGIVEEIFFRLALPLLFLTVTSSVWLAFGLSTLLFGLAHRYQGWIAVVATTVIGAGFGLVYLTSGQLWLAIAVHTLWDILFLVFRPWRMAQTDRITDQTGS